MSTKLTYTGAEVQELLDKIEKGDFDNAKTLEGRPASYFAIASEFTSLAESFATEQGRISALYSYFNNGSANDALRLGGQLPSYYATATQYEILQRALSDFKSLFDSMFEKDSEGNIHAKLSLWSSGGITAGGVGSGSSGGGGGISYNRLDSWSDYSADKAGYVLSALLGKDLDNRVSALANAGYITASYLAPYALRSEIPSLDGYFLASNFNQANIKSTLGISDWALASAKPTYTASEVGALGVNGGTVKGSITANSFIGNLTGNADSASCLRSYFVTRPTSANQTLTGKGRLFKMLATSSMTDGKPDGAGHIIHSEWDITNGYDAQLFLPNNTFQGHHPQWRAHNGGSWGEWITIIDSGNYSDYALSVNGGKLLGSIETGIYTTFGVAGGNFYLGSPEYPLLIRHSGTATINGNIIIHSNNISNYIPTSLPASDVYAWAKQPNKPSYAWSEITSRPTKLSQFTDDVVAGKYLPLSGGTLSGSNRDLLILDTLNTSGPRITLYENGNLIALIGCVPKQTTTNYGAYFVNVSSKFGVILGNDKKAYITLNTDIMSKDYQILHSGNYSNLLAGGTINGSLTATSFIGNLTGTADNSKGLGGYTWEIKQNSIDTWVPVFTFDKIQYRVIPADYNNAPSTLTVKHAGTADSATKLQTPRTIWGQSFDGTQDITGALTAPSITANSLTIGGVTITYDSVNEALCINGNMYALGGVTAGGAGISAYTSLESRVARLEQQLNIS